MRFPRGLLVLLTALLCASSLPALAAPGYRLVPIVEDGSDNVAVFDLNRRGEVVGMRTVAGVTRAFRWRAGQFTDLHDTVDSASSYTQAAGINDRSTVVGVNLAGDSFRGFLLRGAHVNPIAVVAGESQVFPFDVNNRGQIIVDSYGGAQNGSYLIDGASVQFLEGLPGHSDSMHAVAINERGTIAGYTQAPGTRAVLWEHGTIMDLGVVAGADSSFAYDLNDRNQVVGIVSIGGSSHAMRWRDGTMALLPKLAPDQAASSAASINAWGGIVGVTITLRPEFRQTATLWLGNHVVALDSLIRADDPLKPFVHLQSADEINDRGDIVVSGYDSRAPEVPTMYFMTLFDN